MKKFIHQLFAILMVLVMLFDAAPVAVLAEGEDTQLGAEVSASVESGNATGEANPVSRGGQLGVEKANYHLLDASEYTVTSVTGSFDRFLDPNYVPGNASQAEDTRGLSEGEDSAASADDQQTQALAPSAVITPKLSKRSTPVLQTKGALGSVQTLNAKGVEAEPANDLSLNSVSDGESSAAPESPSATVEEPKASDTNAPAVPEPQQVKGLVAYEIELNEGVPFAKEYVYKVKVPVGVNMLKDVKEEPGKIIKINQVNYRLFHLHGETEEEITNVSVTQNDGIISNFTFTTEDFSTFVLVYTVDFEYTDPETGETYSWSFPGTGSHALSEVLAALGIDAEEINTADLELVEAVGEYGEKDLYLTQNKESGEWYINSDAAFDDTYELTVTANGETYKILVTDKHLTSISIDLSIDSNLDTTNYDYYFVLLYNNNPQKNWKYNNQTTIEDSVDSWVDDSTDPEIIIVKLMTGTSFDYWNLPSGARIEDNSTIDGKPVDISVSDNASTGSINATITIGDVGPTTYSASFSFTEDDTPVTTPDLGSGTYYLIAKVGEEEDIYHAQITGSVNPVVFKNSEDVEQTSLNLTKSVVFKLATTIPANRDAFDALTNVTNWNGYTVTAPTGATAGVYAFSAAKTTPTYTAAISGTDFNPNDVAGYYLLAKNGDTYRYYAPLGNLSALKDASDSTVTGGGMKNVDSFEIVKFSGEATMAELSAASVAKLGTGCTVGKSGGFYTVTFPNAPNGSEYQFTAVKQAESAVTLTFQDTSGNTVSGGVTPNGIYYLVAKLNNQYAFYARVYAGTGSNFTFLDDTGAPTNLPATVVDNYVFVKTPSEVNSLAALSSANEVDYLETTDGKRYVLQPGGNQNRVAKAVVVDYTATISGLDNAAAVAGYYLLAKEGSAYKYFAPLGDLSTYTDVSGNPSNVMQDVNGFDIVKYTGSGTPSLSDLSAQSKKLGDHCTVGQAGAYYWINFPTEAIPTEANSSDVYAFTAVKQLEASVSLAFKDTSDTEVTEAVTLDGTYYIVASLNGERAFYAPVASATLTFYAADGNGVTENKLPQGVGYAYEIVKVSEGTIVSSLADLTSGEVVSTMATTGTKEYYLDATGAPALAAREVDINAPLGDTHTTTVRFFDSNVTWVNNQENGYINTSATDQIVPDPALEKYYYVLATIEKTTEEYNVGTGQNETHTQVYWAVKPIALRDLSATSASVTFNAFHTMDVVNGQTQPSADGIHFLDTSVDTVTTRLIHSDISLDVSDLSCVIQDSKYMLSTAVEGANLSDQPETGYRFATGWSENNLSDEIHLYRTDNNNRYKIRLRFSPGSTQAIEGKYNQGGQTSEYYYVIAKIDHANSGTSYAYANVEIPNPSALDVDDDGYYYKDYEFDKWRNYDGTERSDSFTGHEKGIEVRFVRSIKAPDNSGFRPNELLVSGLNDWSVIANAGQIYNETDEMGSYTIHYDTRESRHSNAYYKEDGDGNTVWCYDVINLTSKSASSDYDYTTILGPNLIYGIVAEHLYQPNHLQTNFAVNHFSGHGHDIRPDLSGNSAGNIVIAEFNESDGSCRNSVGAVAYDPVWGRAKIGKPLKGTLFAYVDDDSGDPTGSVYDNPDQTVVVPTNGADLSANIVEPGIEYGKRMSAELLTKPATLSATIVGGKAIIDTTGFDEYDTIYVDGDLLVDYIGTTGGLEIHKKDNQTIVFNFDNRSTSRNITINKFIVKQPSFAQYGYPDGYGTESPEATGSDQNKVMDEIARHIVWNLAECTRKVTIDTAGGIFLQPNDDSEIEIKGTTAGWIVSDGYVYNGTAEWHNVFEEMPESVSVTLTALKTVDGKVPKLADKFNFKLEKLDFTHYQSTGKVNTYSWRQLDVKSNNLAQVQFDTIQQDSGELQVGWNIFRISEIGPHADNTGHFITDTSVYYAAVLVRQIVEQLATTDVIHYYVDQPRYYTSFDVTQFQPFKANQDAFNPVLTGMGAERVAIPTFRNETVTTGLTLMKRVEGTDLTNKKFTFQVKLWTVNEGVKSALGNPITVNGRPVTLTTVNGEGGDSWSTFEISLKNGQKVTIAGLTEGVHYEFTETKVGNKEINNENADADGYIDGYKPLTFTDDGQGNISYTVSDEIKDATAATAETFVNEYKSKGEIGLNVTKTLQDKQLLANMFSFTLTGGQAPIVGYNDEDGNVTFSALPDGKLHFNQSDMAGATKNEDGYLVKEITYVLREGRGTATEPEVNTAWNITDFSYENVVYDSEKVITLVLTDRGDGTITVHPKNTHDLVCEVNFNNKYKEKGHTHFVGSKVMEGRPITKAEFAFDAVLTSIDGTLLPTDAQITAAATDAARAELLQQRAEMLAKVSSARVIGTNAAQTTPDTEGGDTYTADITFPEIYFSAAGTYVYTITENTSSMPADAQQMASSTTSYTATITVAEQDGKLVAGTPVYDPTPMTFTNQTKTIGFNVTKVWLDSNGISASDSKFITFSVMYNGTMLTAAQLSSMLTLTAGSVELDGNNVKLISNDSGEWPTAEFTNVRAGRYVIQEESHSATTNGTLRTTYAVLASGAEDASSTNIVRNDGDTLTITNKESTDRYTRITINKTWQSSDGVTTTSFVPGSGSAKFELWQSKTIGQASTSTGESNVFIDIKDKTTDTNIGSIGNQNNGKYLELIIEGGVGQVSTFLNNYGTYSGPYIYFQYFTGGNFDGKAFDSTDKLFPEALTQAQQSALVDNGTVRLVFKVPIQSVDITDNEQVVSSQSMKVLLQNFNNPGVVSREVKSSSTTTQSKVTTFTVSAPSWSWTSGSLPVSKNDGEMTWQYYIKEIDIPEGVTVTYTPASQTEGQSGMVSSGTINVTNTTTELPKGALKITKLVTINGEPTQTTAADGDYILKVTSVATPTEIYYVKINVVNGVANRYQVAESNDPLTWGNTSVLGSSAIVDDLTPGSYVVEEIDLPNNGMSLASAVRGDGNATAIVQNKVTVEVSANDTAAAKPKAQATFTNNKPYITAHPEVTKAITSNGAVDNTKWPDNVVFGFVLSLVSAKVSADENAADITFSMNDQTKTATKADKTAVFDDIAFTQPGVYTFTITEQEPNPKPAAASHITYDTEAKTVTITVGADENGNLTTPVIRYDGAESLTVNNQYTASGSETLTVRKTFTNGTLTEDQFTFKVTQVTAMSGSTSVDAADLKLSTNPTTASTSGNTNPQTVTLATLNFTQADAGHDFYFKIEEDTTDLTLDANGIDSTTGIRYDTTPQLVKVSVVDNGDGTLTITKTDANGHTISTQDYDVEFTNELLGSLKITKAVTVGGAAWSDSGKASPADGTYTFGVYSDSACSTQVGSDDVTITVTNGQSNTAEVPNLSQGTYYVQEKSSSNVAMTLDTTVHPVTVTAGQSGNNVVNAGIATVTNNYPVTSVTVNKTWLNGSTNINSTIRNAYVTVELRADGNAVTVDASGAAIAPVTLDGDTDTVETVAWTYTWTNLPKYDSTGAEISYTVVETSAKVETNVGTGTDLAPTDATGSMATGFKLTNTLPTRDIVVEKVWSPTGWPTNIASITVGLYTVSGDTVTPYPDAEHQLTRIITAVNSAAGATDTLIAERTFANLPVYDASGNPISYSVKEISVTPAGGGEAVLVDNDAVTVNGKTWTVLNGEVSNGTATVTNTLTSISIQVTKEWTQGGADKTPSANIQFMLYQKLTNPNDSTDTPAPAVFTGAAGHSTGEFTVHYTGTNDTSAWETVTIPNLPITVTRTVGEGDAARSVTYNASYYVVETQAAADAGYVLAAETYKLNNGEPVSDANGAVATANGDKITIINTETAGVELPATGGTGTLPYTLSGLTLLLGAALTLYYRRRRREQN